jgi:hypothetical protein
MPTIADSLDINASMTYFRLDDQFIASRLFGKERFGFALSVDRATE